MLRTDSGFSLLELLLVLALLGLVLAAAVSLQAFGIGSFGASTSQTHVQRGARTAIEYIDRETRLAAAVSLEGEIRTETFASVRYSRDGEEFILSVNADGALQRTAVADSSTLVVTETILDSVEFSWVEENRVFDAVVLAIETAGGRSQTHSLSRRIRLLN